MSTQPVARTCLYCGERLAAEDVVAMCTVCFTGHHEACWKRNGRCSTFRCTGQPRILNGEQYGWEFLKALENANASPGVCTECGGKVYSGRVCVRLVAGSDAKAPGLLFVARERRNQSGKRSLRDWFQSLTGGPRWTLGGMQLKGRSCGSCRTFFLWGEPVNDIYRVQAQERARDRFCVICGASMLVGELRLSDAKFWSDTVPEFHSEWILHQVLDRFVYNRWPVNVRSIPAASCPKCRYTEINGRPVYRLI